MSSTRIPDDWLACVVGDDLAGTRPATPLIGILPGDGVGPEVTIAAQLVLRRFAEATGTDVRVEVGGQIGHAAERAQGTCLPDDVMRFCRAILDRGGAILNGPGGGRYVYDLRRELDLFLKITPIQARTSLRDASPLKGSKLEGVDMLVVRENVGGVYQGSWSVSGEHGDRRARHSFSYGEREVRRFLDGAARLAARRRGGLTVVIKESGVPAISDLWRACGTAAADACGVRAEFVDVDLMAYRLVAAPRDFDVVAAPNMCGDVLGDLAGVLVGGRALTFSGNFSPRGDAVYQTNHGAAHDLAGTDRANPAGQLLSLAMLLRTSLGLWREADAIETSLRRLWRDGHRTLDVAERGSRIVSTSEMATLVADAAAAHLAGARAA